jgi:chemotaxis protein histidine kinase CheA
MSERLHEYFASEATEYLDRLESLLATPGRPDLEQLLRLARGVRGSAQMAGADTLVAVAERLEEGLRAVQADHVAWSDDLRAISAGTVADLKILVRASSRWGPAEEARVRAAIDRWNEAEGVATARHREEESGGVVEIESLFYDDEGPHVLSANDEGEMSYQDHGSSAPVPIESLLLDREGALAEALGMREEIERAMRSDGSAGGALETAIGELFELLEYAVAAGPGRG